MKCDRRPVAAFLPVAPPGRGDTDPGSARVGRRAITIALGAALACTTMRSTSAETRGSFVDDDYHYALTFPAEWTSRRGTKGGSLRLTLMLPSRSTVEVSVRRLPRQVPRYSQETFERIGHDEVDTVLGAYRERLRLTRVMREQTLDKSDDQAMKFWQGTSVFDSSGRFWAVVSTHAICYATDIMVNIVYFGFGNVEADGRAIDHVMDSLTFAGR